MTTVRAERVRQGRNQELRCRHGAAEHILELRACSSPDQVHKSGTEGSGISSGLGCQATGWTEGEDAPPKNPDVMCWAEQRRKLEGAAQGEVRPEEGSTEARGQGLRETW